MVIGVRARLWEYSNTTFTFEACKFYTFDFKTLKRKNETNKHAREYINSDKFEMHYYDCAFRQIFSSEIYSLV